MKYTILLTNDDGYDAKGLKKLRKQLKAKLPNARIIVYAPYTNQSACAHSLSIKNPLQIIKIKKDYYAVKDGTPSDCVCLGFCMLKSLPNLVVSGINNGANLAQDITYSGTLGACMESVLHGVGAVGFSQFYKDKARFGRSSKLAAKLVKKLLKQPKLLKKREFLSVNYPDSKTKYLGYRASALGKRVYTYDSSEYEDPHGRKHYWIKNLNEEYNYKSVDKSDINNVIEGYASITPITLDMTAHKSMKALRRFIGKSKAGKA